jgi:hypothetical protein
VVPASGFDDTANLTLIGSKTVWCSCVVSYALNWKRLADRKEEIMRTVHVFPVAGWFLVAIIAPTFADDIKPTAQEGTESAAPAEDDDELNALLQKVAQRSAGRETRYVVPDGDLKALTEYLTSLSQYRPEDPVDVVEYRKKFRLALQETAERILKLETDKKSEAYEAARFIILANRIYWFASAVPWQQRQVIADVKTYLDEQIKAANARMATNLAERAVKAIQKTGQWEWAIETCESFAAHGKKSNDPEVAQWAESMSDNAGRLRALSKDAPKPPTVEIALKGKLTPIDLAKKLNCGSTDWSRGSFHGNGLAELPKGDKEFCGVKFRIAERLMQLGYSYEDVITAPRAIEGISVDRKLRRLYFLQATKYATWAHVADGTRVAAYKVHYADGSEASIPVVFGQDVRDWWVQDQGMPVTRGRVVWTGSNPAADKAGHTLRFYLGVWENPHPEKTVANLDFVKMDRTTCAPVCLAITAED